MSTDDINTIINYCIVKLYHEYKSKQINALTFSAGIVIR